MAKRPVLQTLSATTAEPLRNSRGILPEQWLSNTILFLGAGVSQHFLYPIEIYMLLDS
jgi:hypothetical protein